MVMADKVAGLHAVSGITMALFHRERTGEGQQIEIPMFETVTSFNFAEHLSGAAFVPPLAAPGYVRVLDANRRPHKTRDGFMVVLPYNDKQAKGFFKAAGRPDLAEDERFSSARSRAAKRRPVLRANFRVDRNQDDGGMDCAAEAGRRALDRSQYA